ncbi:MAG: DUF523 domain-containing protein [Desulfobacteraceae bacterium]|nr:MAG: DUF523 domain-containing protein [Desulfobacteraceae bacterium]
MILVSACLAGIRCKWNSEIIENDVVMNLVKNGEAVPACPEQLGGLATPREPAEIVGAKVLTKTGKDVTEEYLLGARETLRIAQQYNCEKAILKTRSPSCGSNGIYDGTFSGKLISGDGVTAKLLKENGISVLSEGEL